MYSSVSAGSEIWMMKLLSVAGALSGMRLKRRSNMPAMKQRISRMKLFIGRDFDTAHETIPKKRDQPSPKQTLLKSGRNDAPIRIHARIRVAVLVGNAHEIWHAREAQQFLPVGESALAGAQVQNFLPSWVRMILPVVNRDIKSGPLCIGIVELLVHIDRDAVRTRRTVLEDDFRHNHDGHRSCRYRAR